MNHLLGRRLGLAPSPPLGRDWLTGTMEVSSDASSSEPRERSSRSIRDETCRFG